MSAEPDYVWLYTDEYGQRLAARNPEAPDFLELLIEDNVSQYAVLDVNDNYRLLTPEEIEAL